MTSKIFKRRRVNFLLVIILLLLVSIGYAVLSTNLNIIGTGTINNPTWDIHWENVQVKTGSVSASTPTIDTAKTTVNYSVTFTIPGEYFEFTVDAVNAGTIDGMVSVVSNKLDNAEITTLPNYLEYFVTYDDGANIAPNHILAAGTSEKYKVHVGYKKDISSTDIPANPKTLNLSFSVTYVQSDSNAVKPVPDSESFSTDSWPTIIRAVKKGNTSVYNVGDTKTIDMGELGTHTLRIANKSTPVECFTEGFSQTACGFVLEFVDFVAKYRMNPSGEYKGVYYNNGWNVDGWPASAMRTYVNTDVLNSLPVELRNGIIDTKVVSGHGSIPGETNFTSTDKLYLLSTHELCEDDDGDTNSGINYLDTAYSNTRQLDYYSSLGVTTSNTEELVKGSYWWLRTAGNYEYNFYAVNSFGGKLGAYHAFGLYGVSPAFRIG